MTTSPWDRKEVKIRLALESNSKNKIGGDATFGVAQFKIGSTAEYGTGNIVEYKLIPTNNAQINDKGGNLDNDLARAIENVVYTLRLKNLILKDQTNAKRELTITLNFNVTKTTETTIKFSVAAISIPVGIDMGSTNTNTASHQIIIIFTN